MYPYTIQTSRIKSAMTEILYMRGLDPSGCRRKVSQLKEIQTAIWKFWIKYPMSSRLLSLANENCKLYHSQPVLFTPTYFLRVSLSRRSQSQSIQLRILHSSLSWLFQSQSSLPEMAVCIYIAVYCGMIQFYFTQRGVSFRYFSQHIVFENNVIFFTLCLL